MSHTVQGDPREEGSEKTGSERRAGRTSEIRLAHLDLITSPREALRSPSKRRCRKGGQSSICSE